MSDIHNDYSGAHINFEAGSTQNGDVNITGGTFNQQPLAQEEQKRQPQGVEHYTQRQLILLFAELMNISLCSQDTNIKAFASFLAKVGGGSAESIRQKIMKGIVYEDEGVRGDLMRLASDISPFSEEWAEKLTR